MKGLAAVATGLVLVVFCGLGQTGPGAGNEIVRILDLQKSAWNNGDIEGFMAYYLKSDEITFQSGNTRIAGWETVLARYRRNYPSGNMGRLDFTDLAVNILSGDAAYVLGRFKLDIGGEHREGVFTLILRRTGEGWRIVHDHTSSE
jgi:ketosteroid isomerase-like protein